MEKLFVISKNVFPELSFNASCEVRIGKFAIVAVARNQHLGPGLHFGTILAPSVTLADHGDYGSRVDDT